MTNNEQGPGEDARMKATAAIWGISVGMLAISIPLSAVTHSALIPLAVIIGAAIGTCGVWYFGDKNRGAVDNKTPGKSELAAQQRIAELEERLANLETINNFERRLAEEALKRSDAAANIPSGEVARDEQREATTYSSPKHTETES